MGTDTFHSPLHRQRIDFLLAPTGRLEIAPGNARGNLALNEKALKGREKTLIVRPPSQGGAMRSNGDRHSPSLSLPSLSVGTDTLYGTDTPSPSLPLGGTDTLRGQTLPRGDRHFLYLRWGCDGGGLQWVASNGGVRGQTLPLPPRYGDRHYGGLGTDTLSLGGLSGGCCNGDRHFPLALTSVNHPYTQNRCLYSLHSSILRIGNSARARTASGSTISGSRL